MIVGTPCRMIVLVTGWTRICAESGTCLMQTTICIFGSEASVLASSEQAPYQLLRKAKLSHVYQ